MIMRPFGGWSDFGCNSHRPYLCALPPLYSPEPLVLEQLESIVASTPGAGVLAVAIVTTVFCVCLACCGLAVALRRNRAHLRELASEVASLRAARAATAQSVPVRLLTFGRGQRAPGERTGLITTTSSSSSGGRRGRERRRQVLASRRREGQRHSLDLEADDQSVVDGTL